MPLAGLLAAFHRVATPHQQQQQQQQQLSDSAAAAAPPPAAATVPPPSAAPPPSWQQHQQRPDATPTSRPAAHLRRSPRRAAHHHAASGGSGSDVRRPPSSDASLPHAARAAAPASGTVQAQQLFELDEDIALAPTAAPPTIGMPAAPAALPPPTSGATRPSNDSPLSTTAAKQQQGGAVAAAAAALELFSRGAGAALSSQSRPRHAATASEAARAGAAAAAAAAPTSLRGASAGSPTATQRGPPAVSGGAPAPPQQPVLLRMSSAAAVLAATTASHATAAGATSPVAVPQRRLRASTSHEGSPTERPPHASWDHAPAVPAGSTAATGASPPNRQPHGGPPPPASQQGTTGGQAATSSGRAVRLPVIRPQTLTSLSSRPTANQTPAAILSLAARPSASAVTQPSPFSRAQQQQQQPQHNVLTGSFSGRAGGPQGATPASHSAQHTAGVSCTNPHQHHNERGGGGGGGSAHNLSHSTATPAAHGASARGPSLPGPHPQQQQQHDNAAWCGRAASQPLALPAHRSGAAARHPLHLAGTFSSTGAPAVAAAAAAGGPQQTHEGGSSAPRCRSLPEMGSTPATMHLRSRCTGGAPSAAGSAVALGDGALGPSAAAAAAALQGAGAMATPSVGEARRDLELPFMQEAIAAAEAAEARPGGVAGVEGQDEAGLERQEEDDEGQAAGLGLRRQYSDMSIAHERSPPGSMSPDSPPRASRLQSPRMGGAEAPRFGEGAGQQHQQRSRQRCADLHAVEALLLPGAQDAFLDDKAGGVALQGGGDAAGPVDDPMVISCERLLQPPVEAEGEQQQPRGAQAEAGGAAQHGDAVGAAPMDTAAPHDLSVLQAGRLSALARLRSLPRSFPILQHSSSHTMQHDHLQQ